MLRTPSARKFQVLIALLLLAGCVPSTTSGPVRGDDPAPTLNVAGLEAVMGESARTLIQRFGTPDLDVREGNARKLQYSSGVCVLDAYLYPSSGSREPVATWVDARTPDGRDFDRASCVAALIAQAQAR